MKNQILFIFLMVIFFSLYACANTPDTQPLTEPLSAPVYWEGDGGNGIRIAVLEPTGNGLAISERWILSMVQSSITGDFQTFSAMTVVDRQNLDTILAEQRQSLSGDYSDEDNISIGRLTHARYILAGSITRTADAYILELSVTDVESGQRRASYPPTAVSPSALENLSAIREATADLLRQLGVELTDQGRREIHSVRNTAQVQAETALARGITAQRQGTVVEALSYFIQASSYDSGLAEAISRMNVLSADITSGNIGADARNEIAWRRQWVERLQETEAFFARTINEPQPFFIVYSTDIQRGSINFQRETIDLSIRMGFYPDFAWSNHINSVITSIKDGLQATGRTQAWGLNWPTQTIDTPSLFNDRTKNSTSTVVVEIINDQGRSIGSQTVRVPYGFEVKNIYVIPQLQWERNVTFPAVDTHFITDRLVIRISSIDGIAAERAAREKRISIMPQTEWAAVLQATPAIVQMIETAKLQPQEREQQEIARIQKLRQRSNQLDPVPDLFFGDFLWERNSNGITIIGYAGLGSSITIPSQILTAQNISVSVTAIGQEAFRNKQLASVFIPNSVTSIEFMAFSNNHLTSITIPNSVTSIGVGAFQDNQLTRVTIPDSVTSVDLAAFFNNHLTSVTIPNSVTSIEYAAFSENHLTSVTIPNSVTFIDSGMFSHNQLTSVTIPNSVTSIRAYAFSENQLTSITIPNSVTSIGEEAFSVNQLTSITIGSKVRFRGSFSKGFERVYFLNGRRAGTYTRPDVNSTKWKRE